MFLLSQASMTGLRQPCHLALERLLVVLVLLRLRESMASQYRQQVHSSLVREHSKLEQVHSRSELGCSMLVLECGRQEPVHSS